MPQKLRFAMVCASNQNRSMEAHRVLKEHDFNVSSYGVGGHVKLPGPSAKQPNVYDFGTRYDAIHDDLAARDEALYVRNGLLAMLRRNAAVKAAPEKWQLNRDVFDAVVCFEEKVMQQVVDDLTSRPQSLMKPVLVVNIDVKDNHEEAAKVAPQTLQLCRMLEAAESWEGAIDDVLTAFEREHARRATYTICYY
ncbi:SSU72 [Scenedesmus sp. PABB004]|nr:SSU72 [Scenedesmus sp. PABB004]